MNSKTLCSTRKYWDMKWEEFKAKNIKWEHTKSIKYHYHVKFLLNDCINTFAYFYKELKNKDDHK